MSQSFDLSPPDDPDIQQWIPQASTNKFDPPQIISFGQENEQYHIELAFQLDRADMLKIAFNHFIINNTKYTIHPITHVISLHVNVPTALVFSQILDSTSSSAAGGGARVPVYVVLQDHNHNVIDSWFIADFITRKRTSSDFGHGFGVKRQRSITSISNNPATTSTATIAPEDVQNTFMTNYYGLPNPPYVGLPPTQPSPRPSREFYHDDANMINAYPAFRSPDTSASTTTGTFQYDSSSFVSPIQNPMMLQPPQPPPPPQPIPPQPHSYHHHHPHHQQHHRSSSSSGLSGSSSLIDILPSSSSSSSPILSRQQQQQQQLTILPQPFQPSSTTSSSISPTSPPIRPPHPFSSTSPSSPSSLQPQGQPVPAPVPVPALASASTSAPSQPSSSSSDMYANLLHKAELVMEGTLEDMTKDWTKEEIESRRRLVRFYRRQHQDNKVLCRFESLQPSPTLDYKSMIVVSCIYWEEANDYYITSVDCIYLLESLIGVTFTVEEKNRVRRNLEGFKPLTVSKLKPASSDFFKLIMAFPNPKPRNIEKDVKIFPWSILETALKKIISKYTASYSSTASVNYDVLTTTNLP